MDAIRRIDEMKEFRKRLPSSAAYVVRVKPAGPKLEPGERAVYDQCNGDATVAEVAQRLRLTEFDATKILHHLISMGLVAARSAPQTASGVAMVPTPEVIAATFNAVFREIHSEVAKINRVKEFVAAANGALAQQAQKAPVLAGAAFGPDLALAGPLLENLRRLGQSPTDSARTSTPPSAS
jgi:DNA-binding MarR family transcriptional regulator